MTKNDLKICKVFYTVSTIIAWTFSLSLILIYLQATCILGHFPSYGAPDPKSFSFYDTYESIITMIGNVWLITFILWIIFTSIFLYSHHTYLKSKVFMFGLCGQILVAFVLFSRIVEWWID